MTNSMIVLLTVFSVALLMTFIDIFDAEADMKQDLRFTWSILFMGLFIGVVIVGLKWYFSKLM